MAEEAPGREETIRLMAELVGRDLGIAVAIKRAIAAADEFERVLARVKAVSGHTAAELAELDRASDAPWRRQP